MRRALLVAFVSLVATAPLATAAEPSVESQVFLQINRTRTDALALHSGLLSVAREHSMHMAMHGGLDHNNADSRIRNAPPDPAEANGAPDDGSPPASWCENVTYSVGTSESEASQRIYQQWERSGAHHRCMNDTRRNVGAVGVYYDGQSWWATFIAMVDNTPPARAAPPPPRPTNEPAPSASAEASEPPARDTTPDERDEAEPSGLIASIDEPVATSVPTASATSGTATPIVVRATVNHPGNASSLEAEIAPTLEAPDDIVLGYGWQELAAVCALLLLAASVLARSMRRGREVEPPSEVERRDDVALPEVEPVGVGSLRP